LKPNLANDGIHILLAIYFSISLVLFLFYFKLLTHGSTELASVGQINTAIMKEPYSDLCKRKAN
jgi:hypothetical protein